MGLSSVDSHHWNIKMVMGVQFLDLNISGFFFMDGYQKGELTNPSVQSGQCNVCLNNDTFNDYNLYL